MRKIKVSKFERVAGVFVLGALIGFVGVFSLSAIKQGWFERKVHYSTTFENADGVYQGSTVLIAGLKAGAVEEVRLDSKNRIHVDFYVLGRFEEKIRENSIVQLTRPFVIGDRVLEVSLGSEDRPLMKPESHIASHESMDLMSIMSGKNLNAYFERLTKTLESIHVVMDAFADKSRAESFVKIFDKIDPLMVNLNAMAVDMTKLSRQATKDDGVRHLIQNLALTSGELNRILPELNSQNPELAKDLAMITRDLSKVTRALGPAFQSVEQDLPGASQRLVETLNETVVVLKAMQKSFFMKSNVREVMEEENQRLPAGQKTKSP